MLTRCLSMVLCVLLTTILIGCGLFGPSAKTVSTRVDPASVTMSDSFTEKMAGDTRKSSVKVEPGACAVPATMPGIVITQAPTPISLNIDGRTITAPAGSSVVVETSDVKVPAETTHTRTGNAVGPTLRTDADRGNFSGTAPAIEFGTVTNTGIGGGGSAGGAGSATGGDMGAAWSAMIASATAAGAKWGWLVGLALIVGGVGMIVVSHIMGTATDWPLVAMLAGGGLAVIVVSVVADKYPWMFLLLFLGAIAAVVVYEFVWRKKSTPATPTPTP